MVRILYYPFHFIVNPNTDSKSEKSTFSSLQWAGLFLAGYSLPPGDLLLISGFIFNSAAFVLCAVVLYHLALAAMRHEELAFRTSLLFCFSPANPFFLALYTESTFALTSFAGIYCALYGTGGPLQRVSWTMLSALLFALSTTIRSNGMILVGFLIYMAVARAWSALRRRQYIQTFGELVLGGVSAVVAIVPLLLYLYSSYERYCTNGVSRPWCDATVPNIYSFVQNFYWNVGFLNYYRIHQIPNFLLAAPVIILSISAIYTFVKSDWPNTWTLGLNSTAARVEGIRNRSSASPSSLLSGFYNPENFVHLAHLFALLISALPFIHIQVITRFLLSQCPILYCYLAEVISASSTPLRAKQALLLYIVVFNVLGMILFANFLPWT